MSIEKVAVKCYSSHNQSSVTALIPVFHRWIQEDVVGGIPLDVADYRHVPNGPGVLLIGHDADWGVDEHEGPHGLIYNHKRNLQGETDADRIAFCVQQLLHAVKVLHSEDSLDIRFSSERLRLVFNDRLQQPNDDSTFEALRPAIETALSQVFGEQVEAMIERDTTDPRWRLTVHVALSPAPSFA
ncbi:MAG: hypothetical protein EA401_02555 [Planctomycetota bacterium]|nr:MAG: hypothetical protein EA401_02555 [Planctomycetota bacterium]